MKKIILPTLLAFVLLISALISVKGQSGGQEKFVDHYPILSLGNGKMCIYENGPDIINAYTGPYSTPSFLKLEWLKGENEESQAVRKPGTAIWTHTMFAGNSETGKIVDFVDGELPCFVRHIQNKNKTTFRVKLENYVQVIDNSKRLNANKAVSGLLMIIPSGKTIYQTYVYPRMIYNQILATGNAKIQSVPGSGIIDIICEPGESYLYLVGGPEYPDVMNNTKQILATSPESLLTNTISYWEKFTKSRIDFTKRLPAGTPSRSKLLQTIDDVAILLKTQQSIQGAVLAGYPYPLGYVRDQYGVSRGMLSLGLYSEAKSILNFYWQIWKKYGYIHNAQAIGVDGIFHIHENDEVESTGYLILQAFDLMKATHDVAFMKTIAPMLDWAFFSQKKYLVKDMLPFNGDETYVAGGLLPRTTLNDGSAESTMLFVESGQKYLDWVAAQKRWKSDVIAENRAVISRVKASFKDNFMHDGLLWTNNPERAKAAELPRFRHGVCEKGGPNCLMSIYQGIVWTERNENDRYVCANCISEEPLPRVKPVAYNLLSVSMEPFYMGFTIIPLEQLKPAVQQILEKKKDETRSVGYDYGFLLTALNKLKHPEALTIYNKTLSIVDKRGAWSEYYQFDNPSGTRCRPWESAINIESLIDFVMTKPN